METPSTGDTRTEVPPLGFHVTMRLAEDRVLARTVRDLRLLSRLLIRHGGARGLVGFAVADTHLHAVIDGPRELAGRFAQVLETAVRRATKVAVPFDRARFKAIRDVWHLRNTLQYVVKQDTRHGLEDRLHDGSMVPDVLGLRCVDPTMAVRIKQALPRVKEADWVAWAGWTGWETAPMPMDALGEAAAAAVGRTVLNSKVPACRAARVAACQLARETGTSIKRIATLLRMSTRAVYEALACGVDPAVKRAVEGQLRLRGRLGVGASRP